MSPEFTTAFVFERQRQLRAEAAHQRLVTLATGGRTPFVRRELDAVRAAFGRLRDRLTADTLAPVDNYCATC